MAKLSKTELMALDLAIQMMRDEQMGVQVSPEAFIGGIVNITRRVVNVTRRVTPVVKVATQITPVVAQIGGRARSATSTESLRLEDENVEPDISVEALIALRKALVREDED